MATLASSNVFASSESGVTFKRVGIWKPVPLILCDHQLRRVFCDGAGNESVPELSREVDGLVNCETTISCAADVRGVVFVLDWACTGLELAEEKIVEAFVFRDIWLDEFV